MAKEITTKQGKSEVGYKKPPKEHQFKPGQSGNPKGPPKATVQYTRYQCEYLNMTLSEIKQIDRSKLTLAQTGALRGALKIGDGDLPRTKEMLERTEGKVAQAVELSGGVDPVKYYQGVDPEKV